MKENVAMFNVLPSPFPSVASKDVNVAQGSIRLASAEAELKALFTEAKTRAEITIFTLKDQRRMHIYVPISEFNSWRELVIPLLQKAHDLGWISDVCVFRFCKNYPVY